MTMLSRNKRGTLFYFSLIMSVPWYCFRPHKDEAEENENENFSENRNNLSQSVCVNVKEKTVLKLLGSFLL